MQEFCEIFSRRTNWNLTRNRLSKTISELKLAGKRVLDLTQSNPTECGFSYPEKAMQDAFADSQMLHYRPDPHGLRESRQAIASYYRELQVTVAPDDLVLTSGTSEAYSFVFRLLCDPGDEVLIPSPGYPLFDFLADLCDIKLVRYPLIYDHGWQIDFSALASAVSNTTRAVIVVHPNNPTGHFASPSESAALLQFCADRRLALIADEVFLDFAQEGNRQQSFAAQNNVLTFTLSGLSKICGLPQMKLAWIAVSGPPETRREALDRLEVIADAYLSVGTPVQLAGPKLLDMRAAFQSQVIARVAANLRELDGQLKRQAHCSRLRCEAGWSAVLRVPAIQTDEEFAIALLTEKSVSVHPGHFYDFAQPGYAVVSLIVPEAEFAEGIRRVLEYIR